VASELAKCNFIILQVQEVRWAKSGSQPADNYTFFYGNRNTHHYLGSNIFVHKRIRSAVKMAQFISDRMSYIILRGRCDIIFLHMHASSNKKVMIQRTAFMRSYSMHFTNS
jgi:hypothetical protein